MLCLLLRLFQDEACAYFEYLGTKITKFLIICAPKYQ